MRTRDREYINAEATRDFESFLKRAGEYATKVQELGVMVPNLPPWETYASMRRKIERLRAGKVQGLDPRIPREALARLMELSIEKDMITRSAVADVDDRRELERRITERLEVERFRRSVAVLHTLKQSPEATDPESPVAEKVRHLSRQRRNKLGRPRKRKA